MEVSPLQPENADILMYVTEKGIVNEDIPVQFKNALDPILVTVLGIKIDVNVVSPEKALWPIAVTA